MEYFCWMKYFQTCSGRLERSDIPPRSPGTPYVAAATAPDFFSDSAWRPRTAVWQVYSWLLPASSRGWRDRTPWPERWIAPLLFGPQAHHRGRTCTARSGQRTRSSAAPWNIFSDEKYFSRLKYFLHLPSSSRPGLLRSSTALQYSDLLVTPLNTWTYHKSQFF